MTRYVVVRLYSMGLTLLGLTVLVFLMLRLIPGTVVEQMIGADAIVSPAMVAELTRFFGLDQPWWMQYGRWLGELLHGNLGTSWRTGKPVLALIAERLPVTLELTTLAVVFSLLLGIPAGIVSAARRDQAVDNVTRVGTLLGLSVPVFWQGTMLILFFSIYLRWMPPVVWVDFFTDPRRNLTIMLLPAVCLGTASVSTPGPSSSTTPEPSSPSTMGTGTPCQLPSKACRQLWHTPLAAMRTRTSPARGGSRSTSSTTSGFLCSSITEAFI
jgi:peptide/nickel transport system permease protein